MTKKKVTKKNLLFVDPSKGKACGPVCVIHTEEQDVGFVCYGDPQRSIRTYFPGEVDARALLNAVFVDTRDEFKSRVLFENGLYVVPVSLVKEFAEEFDEELIFADPETQI